MTSTSATTFRVKEKIRYDINIHREQNKQILLNTRRGVIVEEIDSNDTFTIENMHRLAFEIKDRKLITVKHLKLLKHALLYGQEFILAFYHVQGAVNSLLHYTFSKNETIQLAAIECFCNMAIGDNKTCVKLAKLITPYLMIYINNLNFNLAALSIWTLGNLSASKDSCKLLQNQNFFKALIYCLENSTCDEVILNTHYALKLFLKTYIYDLEMYELTKLLYVCFEHIHLWKESLWIVYQISCRQDCDILDKTIIKRLFSYIHKEKIIDIKSLVSILRTFGNIVAKDQSGCSAIEFITGLQNDGSVIKNILIQNKQINLNDECAWLLGNVFNVLKVTEHNENINLVIEHFDEFCNYLFI